MPQLFAAFANQAYEYKDDDFQGRDSFIKPAAFTRQTSLTALKTIL